jgi:Relaxase/Mobilisation nuclease domain
MIGVSSKGRSFSALAAYLAAGRSGEDRDRVAWSAARNVPTNDPELAAKIMRATAEQSVRVKQPVYHLVLSFDPADQVDRATMERVADRMLERLGLQDHQAVIVAHRDREHRHVHVLVNRVHPETGRVWDRSFDYRAVQEILREEERALGLRRVPGRFAEVEVERPVVREAVARGPAPRSLSVDDGEHVRRVVDREVRSEAVAAREVALRDRARDAVGALRAAGSWAELEERLGAIALRLERRAQGLVVSDGEVAIKSSVIARDLSLPQLERRFGSAFVASNVTDLPAVQAQPRASSFSVPVPPFAPEVSLEMRDLARDLALLERRSELVAAQYAASMDARAARARVDQIDRATERAARARAAMERAFTAIYREPDRAAASVMLAAGQGGEQAAEVLRTRPETYGELVTVERSRALGLRRVDDDAVARQRAVEAIPIVREAGTAVRALADTIDRAQRPKVGPARVVEGLGPGPSPVAARGRDSEGVRAPASDVRTASVAAGEGAVRRERDAASALDKLPAAALLERGIQEAVRRLTPVELQQLRQAVTAPQLAIAMRVREAVREALIGRDGAE